jgi:hypothetical protein
MKPPVMAQLPTRAGIGDSPGLGRYGLALAGPAAAVKIKAMTQR